MVRVRQKKYRKKREHSLSKFKKSINKGNFKNLDDFFNFANEYLEFIETGLQAKIIAQNEINYTFFQYKKDGRYNI